MRHQDRIEKYSSDAPSFVELDNDEYRPFAASPSSWSPGSIAHNIEFDRRIVDFIRSQAPKSVSSGVRAAIELNYSSAKVRLILSNNEALTDLMARKKDELTNEQFGIIQKAEVGLAQPDELFSLVEMQDGLASTELAKLTHPYGARSEYLIPMYALIGELIDNKFAKHHRFPDAEPSIKFFHHGYSPDHLVFTAKSRIAFDGNIAVVERRTFALQANPDLGFDADMAARMEDESTTLDPHESKLSARLWKERVFINSGLLNRLQQDLANVEMPEYIIPVSTVIYTYHVNREKDHANSKDHLVAIAPPDPDYMSGEV